MNNLQRPLLVVEDNLDDYYILKRCIKLAGIENALKHVENGQLAIDYLQGIGAFSDRTAFPLPLIVLLDLKLPMKHGFEVLSWAKNQPMLRRITFIMLTSSSDDKDISKAYDLGANAFLVKPSSSEKLTDLIKSVESFWLKQNQFSPSGSN